MNLHEYQAKNILRKHRVAVPEGILAINSQEAREAAKELQIKTQTDTWAVKAQIHAGGRGKGGGVKIAHSIDEVEKFADEIIGMNLVTPQTDKKGKLVRMVLVEEGIYIKGNSVPQEFYMSILLDRAKSKNVIIYSTEGGMDIEEVAEKTPHKIFREIVEPALGLMPFQARKIAFKLGLKEKSLKSMVEFVLALYQMYVSSDAALIEINPLFKNANDEILAADAKVIIEDNALLRQKEIKLLKDPREEEPLEIEAQKHNLNYIKLDGNVGCMVNGAGLAMATMDIIKFSGGEPANFLDVGGMANAQTVEAGFRIILKDPHVKAILINIFGGIVRCDRVAEGVIQAYKNIGTIDIPVIVRLQGTNAEKAAQIIKNAKCEVFFAALLQEAADKIKELM